MKRLAIAMMMVGALWLVAIGVQVAVADAHTLTKPKAKRAIERWAYNLGQQAHPGVDFVDSYADECVRFNPHRVWCIANWEYVTLQTDVPGGTPFYCVGGAYASVRKGSWKVRVREDPTTPAECF